MRTFVENHPDKVCFLEVKIYFGAFLLLYIFDTLEIFGYIDICIHTFNKDTILLYIIDVI